MILQDRVCIVAGASRGIGRAAALAIGAAGAAVVATSRDLEACDRVAGEITARGGRARAFAANVTSAADMEAAVAFTEREFGGVDLAFNNAGGIFGTGSVVETPAERFRAQIDTNLMGVWHALRAQIPAVARRGGGAIVINAARGGLRGTPGLGTYAAAKAAAIMLGLVAAQEAAKQNVRINVIAPGFIGTESWWKLMGEGGKALTARVPLGRIGVAAEVADVVVWLLSDASRYVTGTVLPIDGGMTAG